MDESLNLIIYFVGSGLAFFGGVSLVLLGIAVAPFSTNRFMRLCRDMAVFVGGVFVTISATPLPWWLYAMMAVVTLIWLPMEWLLHSVWSTKLRMARVATTAIWLMALGLELPYHCTPTLPAMGNPSLFLIGDSVSAGMVENDQGTWPKLLAKKHEVTVHDFSKMGATVGSAHKQAAKLGDDSGLVLLEIGGNDLLGTTTADQYEERLELLLADVCRPGRTVVMLELPLAPLANRFGEIQRRLASRHGVILIPKRWFIDVLTTSGATVDGVHLTRSGHELMAATMWQLLAPAFRDKQ